MKISLPNFRRTPSPRPHKLEASARRATPPASDDYQEEPTMRLSSALVVVFILHLVAAGGLWAFSNFKAKHSDAAAQQDVRERLAVPTLAPAAAPMAVPKSIDASAVPKDSGETYLVQKGDNPVAIAKHVGVKYDELLKLNHIDDPRRLQIGQKLHLPVKSKHVSKPEPK